MVRILAVDACQSLQPAKSAPTAHIPMRLIPIFMATGLSHLDHAGHE
jgi:hypothetical protein